MATTWGVVRERLRRALTDVLRVDDEGSSITPAFSNTELMDYWNSAQDELVIYAALEAVAEYAAGSESEALPDDFYKVKWVRYDVSSDEYYLNELPLLDLGGPHDPTATGLYWSVRNDTTILFSEPTEYACTVCYAAYYPALTNPDTDATAISVPRWAVLPLQYFAIAQAIERRLIEDADLRRWAAKTMDAGQPTSNPYPQVGRWYLDRFREEMDKHRR